MRLHLLAVGARQPSWIREGVETFVRRMPRECALKLVEIPSAHRGKANAGEGAVRKEGERILKAVPDGALVVALDVAGIPWSTQRLSEELQQWRQNYDDVALLIGGPDGLSPECLNRAGRTWSLSALTLPHGIVRIVAAEQIYRAWTIINGHPYHRK
jgi:23S rRNA (pseudouridine1915-N3)-methyltransferase